MFGLGLREAQTGGAKGTEADTVSALFAFCFSQRSHSSPLIPFSNLIFAVQKVCHHYCRYMSEPPSINLEQVRGQLVRGCIPMVSECLFCHILVLQLPKCPLSDNVHVPGIIEYAWCDLGLLHVSQRRGENDVVVCLLQERATCRAHHRPLWTHTRS